MGENAITSCCSCICIILVSPFIWLMGLLSVLSIPFCPDWCSNWSRRPEEEDQKFEVNTSTVATSIPGSRDVSTSVPPSRDVSRGDSAFELTVATPQKRPILTDLESGTTPVAGRGSLVDLIRTPTAPVAPISPEWSSNSPEENQSLEDLHYNSLHNY